MTQWRTSGMGVPTGMDYGVLFHKMDRMGLAPDDYEDLESDIRVMESEARSAMFDIAEEQRRQQKKQ